MSQALDPAGVLTIEREGVYCPEGKFFIDPRIPVDRAIITHAHSDHARPGSKHYLTSQRGLGVLKERVGYGSPSFQTLGYGEQLQINGVTLSLHPSGHLLGASQVRIERQGYTCVVTGDYKRQPDSSCDPFEIVSCNSFFTECTFGLPVYSWPTVESVQYEIHNWWRKNQEQGITSVLFAYALGKAQRILAVLDDSIGPIGVHGSIEKFDPHYKAAGISLAEHSKVTPENRSEFTGRGLIIAPGSTAGSPWLRKFSPMSLAFASGWMQIRGSRRRQALDRGFVLSDHVDWNQLHQTIYETGAEFVGTMHGFTSVVTQYLNETGIRSIEVGSLRDRDEAEED